MSKLAILGASGHGKVVADAAECCGWASVYFFDDAWPCLTSNGDWPVVGDSAALLQRVAEFDGVLVAIGNNRTRFAKMQELQAVGAKLVSLIHPAATVSRYATIAVGSVVFAGAIVNVGARIGCASILNTGCSVDHDCILGDAVHISPGARLAGGVQLGELSWVGIGASVRQLTIIGKQVMVGAGAVVVASVPDNVTVIGVPAEII